jgi:hypothetical protein
MKKSGGVYVKLNGNQPVQRVPSRDGVGPTKSKKQDDAQKTPGSKGVGPTKSKKVTVPKKK